VFGTQAFQEEAGIAFIVFVPVVGQRIAGQRFG
jgi:hypothetical protein